MNNASRRAPRRRWLAGALVLAGLAGTVSTAATAATAQTGRPAHAGTATGDMTRQTIHLIGHEKQRKLLNEGGFGDEEIFRGILDNATGTTQVGIFAGTLTSISSDGSLNLATVDLQLPGGQITVQGFFFGNRSRIVHGITGGTGRYAGAGGEFFLTFPSRGVLDMKLILLR